VTAREVLDGIKAQHSGHVKCMECGKCRVSRQEWCLICDYWSCEDDTACKDDPAPENIERLTGAVEAVLNLHAPRTDGSDEPYCRHCHQAPYGHAPYPCPTVAAIENALNP